jgi:hypothetical protein
MQVVSARSASRRREAAIAVSQQCLGDRCGAIVFELRRRIERSICFSTTAPSSRPVDSLKCPHLCAPVARKGPRYAPSMRWPPPWGCTTEPFETARPLPWLTAR